VIVVGVSVKDPRDLVDTHPKGVEGMDHARPRVYQVDSALKHEDTRHARSIDIPSVTLSGVDDREVFSFYLVLPKNVGRLVLFGPIEVETHLLVIAVVGDAVGIDRNPFDVRTRGDLNGVVFHSDKIDHLLGLTDRSKGELRLDTHILGRGSLIETRREELLLRDKSIVPAENILSLRCDLFTGTDDLRFLAGVVWVPRNDHTLAVKHLQNGKLRQVCELAVLDSDIGEEDRVWTALKMGAVALYRGNVSPSHQMFYGVGGGTAEDAEIDVGNFDPVDAGGNC
jgi:hypothetical protein